jgi:hypothetical protein
MRNPLATSSWAMGMGQLSSSCLNSRRQVVINKIVSFVSYVAYDTERHFSLVFLKADLDQVKVTLLYKMYDI